MEREAKFLPKPHQKSEIPTQMPQKCLIKICVGKGTQPGTSDSVSACPLMMKEAGGRRRVTGAAGAQVGERWWLER